jgi:hypothetical protein
MSLPDDLKARVMAAAHEEPSPTIDEERRRRRLIGVVAVAIALAGFVAAGGVHLGQRAQALVVGSAGGAALIALWAASIALSRGGSMLGRPRWQLVTVALAAPLLLVTWKLLWSARFAGGLAAVAGRPGLRCLGLSLALAIAPLVAILWARRGRDSEHPRVLGAAAAVAVGAVVWIAVDGWCPIGDPSHVLLGHFLPLALLGVIGALVGERVLGVKTERRR